MLAKARKQLRSWMFVYIALVAAIMLSGQPATVEAETRAEGSDLPAISSSPLLRRDI